VEVQSLISFRDEILKIASPDGETRANMVERMGGEYLQGGELASNDPRKQGLSPKIAEMSSDDLEHKSYKSYNKYREPAKSAFMGALPGAWAGNLLGTQRMGKNPSRAGALIGAGLGTADWIASGKARKWVSGNSSKTTKAKTAEMGSQTFTPGRAKAQSSAVGSFQDKTIHNGSRLRPMKMGQKFSIPSEPGQ